jgi:DNA-binding transcriptional ArsR family regulator
MEINDQQMEKMMAAAEKMKLLSHPLRLGILCILIDAGEVSVGEIVQRLERHASASQISQYLKQFRDHDIVKTRRDGTTIYYNLESPLMKNIMQYLYHEYCS